MGGPLGYVIAEVWECNLDELGYGTWLNERCLTLRCPGCRGDGTRVVVTGVEVDEGHPKVVGWTDATRPGIRKAITARTFVEVTDG